MALPKSPNTRKAQKRVPAYGYFTEHGRQQWLKYHGVALDDETKTLEASPDLTKPLYFWQLYSVLGKTRVHKLVSDFYRRVFDDEEAWFRDAFRRIAPLDHHVATQTAFWLDAMGAGRWYHGGDYRLQFHHQHNAFEVMTKEGAVRWMMHMRATLSVADLTDDPRVRPTIDSFLHLMMQKYAKQFEFNVADLVYNEKPNVEPVGETSPPTP